MCMFLLFFREGLLHEGGHVPIRPRQWSSCCGRCHFAQHAALSTPTNPWCGCTSTSRPPTTTDSHKSTTCEPPTPSSTTSHPPTQPPSCCRSEFSSLSVKCIEVILTTFLPGWESCVNTFTLKTKPNSIQAEVKVKLENLSHSNYNSLTVSLNFLFHICCFLQVLLRHFPRCSRQAWTLPPIPSLALFPLLSPLGCDPLFRRLRYHFSILVMFHWIELHFCVRESFQAWNWNGAILSPE